MKVFARPTGLHSRAMTRVANAIERYAPPGVEFVKRPEDADLQFLHIIDWHEDLAKWPRAYVAIQYCLATTSKPKIGSWMKFWHQAQLVWSYYDLQDMASYCWGFEPFNFYHSPLGVDDAFKYEDLSYALDCETIGSQRRNGIITSGYVSGVGAEAIGEVWAAAESTGMPGFHIGPSSVVGIGGQKLPPRWSVKTDISDEDLADLYRRSAFVSGLRYGEGFELPAAEGLCSGAKPILFNQASQRRWYGTHAIYYDVLSDRSLSLTHFLEGVFSSYLNLIDRQPSSAADVEYAHWMFNWRSIMRELWKKVQVPL